MRTQTEGSVITAVMKREYQTQKIITLLLIYLPQIHLLETTVKFKLNHTKNETLTYQHVQNQGRMIFWQDLFSCWYIKKYINYEI